MNFAAQVWPDFCNQAEKSDSSHRSLPRSMANRRIAATERKIAEMLAEFRLIQT